LIKAGLARTFQTTNVFPGVSVRENVELAVRSRTGKNFHIFPPCGTLRGVRARTEEIVEFAGLAEMADRRADSLAHGDLRILEVAIAYALDPKVLCLDEPTAGMARAEIPRIIALIRRLREHASVLLIEHDMDVVLSISDVVTVLVSGAVLASGSPKDIQGNNAVQEAYLGKTSMFEMQTILD
jgi:branched-chain amino acid transport system ATP-binding protein